MRSAELPEEDRTRVRELFTNPKAQQLDSLLREVMDE